MHHEVIKTESTLGRARQPANRRHGVSPRNTSCDGLGELLAKHHTTTPAHNQKGVKIEQ
jgi:hypothetical protein